MVFSLLGSYAILGSSSHILWTSVHWNQSTTEGIYVDLHALSRWTYAYVRSAIGLFDYRLLERFIPGAKSDVSRSLLDGLDILSSSDDNFIYLLNRIPSSH